MNVLPPEFYDIGAGMPLTRYSRSLRLGSWVVETKDGGLA